MNFCCLDEREVWHRAACSAAERHGYLARRIRCGEEVEGEGIGFIRPHADPSVLRHNREDFARMAERLVMIQDRGQMDVYENKSAQYARWGEWMPDTWRFTTFDAAAAFLDQVATPYPLVSKANEGASSTNVRILADRAAAHVHIAQIFNRGGGVRVSHCSGGAHSMQRDYVLLQRFIPHTVTWRVNAMGNARAIFRRFNYPHRPVAQTGNVEPVWELSEETESLLEYADRFFRAAGTKWCALDILCDLGDWKLLETSLAWPWPSPGDCDEGPIFRTRKKWRDMFDVMFDEVERGEWAYAPRPHVNGNRENRACPR